MRRFFASRLSGGAGSGILGVTLVTLVSFLTIAPRRAIADTIPADKLPEVALADKLPPVEAEYLRRVHAHIHKRWADNFLRLIGEQIPAQNPLNSEPGRTAEVDVTVGADGQMISSRVST